MLVSRLLQLERVDLDKYGNLTKRPDAILRLVTCKKNTENILQDNCNEVL